MVSPDVVVVDLHLINDNGSWFRRSSVRVSTLKLPITLDDTLTYETCVFVYPPSDPRHHVAFSAQCGSAADAVATHALVCAQFGANRVVKRSD